MVSRFSIKLIILYSLLCYQFQAFSKESKKRSLYYSLYSKFETDFKEFDQNDKTLNLLAVLGLNYVINKKSSIGLNLPFLKSFSGKREFNYLDGSLSYNYQFFNNRNNLSLKSYLSIALPYSKASREVNYLQTKLTFSPTLTYNLKDIKELSLSLNTTFSKSFHRSNTNAFGSSNHSFIWSLSIGTNYLFKNKNSFNFKGSFLKMTTYGGFTKDNYSFEATFSRPLTKKINGTFGINNGGEVLDYNGDLNAKVFDINTSQIFISLSYSF